MKYSFSKDSTNLIITLDTESGKYAPEVTSLNDPNITLENGSFWIYENGQFLRFLSFDQISTIDGVIPSNVDDAFTKLNTIINTLHLLASPKFKGTAVPTDTPTGTEDAFWIASQAGTYTNFGGVVVSANSRAEISRVSGVFSISQNAFDLSSYSTNAKVSKVAVKSTINNDSTTLLDKFREYNLGYETWIWTDASATAGIKPNLANMPIWSTTTNGFLSIPITNLDIQTSTNFGVIYECYSLLNDASFGNPGVYLQVNGTYMNSSLIKREKIGLKYVQVAKYNLASIPAGATLNLVLSVKSTNGAQVVGELSNVRLFYMNDADVTNGLFTVKDKNTAMTDDLSVIKTSIESKHSLNYLNPATFRYGYFYYSGQNPTLTAGAGFGVTDYIPVNTKGLTTLNAGKTVDGLSSYAVFGANKNWIRNGQNSDSYTYVLGDAFVVFVYKSVSQGFPKTKAVTIGSTYIFDKYTDNVPLQQLSDKVDGLANIGVNDVINGTSIIYGNVENFLGSGIIGRDIQNDNLTLTKTGTGNLWAYTPSFTPNGQNLLHIKFKAEFSKIGTDKGIQVIVAQGTTVTSKYLSVGGPIRTDGDYDITIDPAYYNVYEGFTNFYIWILNESILAGETMNVKLTGLKVLEYDNSVKGSNIGGLNSKELFESTDLQLSNIKSQISSVAVFVSPLGKKFELNISDSGVISSVPVIPTKAVYFGNSLIGGFGYGMAASEAQYDYYNRINTYISSINPTFTYSIKGAAGFESVITEGALVSAINTMIASLAGDETLVSIQLGDNVNTTEKNAIFNAGGGCLRLLQAVRAKCPNARVVWMGMWYGSTERYTTIENSCKATGSKFINLSSLITNDAMSAIGNISKIGTATRTLSGVTSVVDNSATNITVNFTVSSVSYQSTLNITSYSLSVGVLTYTGQYEIISNSGVASHPGDEGFRRIANKFLYELQLTADKEYYK